MAKFTKLIEITREGTDLVESYFSDGSCQYLKQVGDELELVDFIEVLRACVMADRDDADIEVRRDHHSMLLVPPVGSVRGAPAPTIYDIPEPEAPKKAPPAPVAKPEPKPTPAPDALAEPSVEADAVTVPEVQVPEARDTPPDEAPTSLTGELDIQNSSLLDHAWYNDKTRTLYLRYAEQQVVYEYTDVPPVIWIRLRDTVRRGGSAGHFFNKQIRMKFKSDIVEQETAEQAVSASRQ